MASDSNSAVETSSDSDESSLELSYASSTFGSAGEEGSEPAGIHSMNLPPAVIAVKIVIQVMMSHQGF